MEIIFNFLLKDYPELTIIIVNALVVCAILMWHPIVRDARKKLEELTCKEHGQRISDLEKKTEYIRGSLDNMRDFHKSLVNRGNSVVDSESPLKLTKTGLKLSDDNKLQSIIDSNWSKVESLLKGYESQNPYDLQQFCFDIAFMDIAPNSKLQFLTEKDINRLKIFAYRTGESLFSFAQILGILIRDKYFKENNIDVEDIDDDPYFNIPEKNDENII